MSPKDVSPDQGASNEYRVVLTGGPSAGKTAILELARKTFGKQVYVLEEAAGITYRGGFPRRSTVRSRASAQRVIFRIQCELEEIAAEAAPGALHLCDRGTLDGIAYWPGTPNEFLAAFHTSESAEHARYAAVVHLRTPQAGNGYEKVGVRIESAEEAHKIDEELLRIWQNHPRRFVVESTSDFMEKASAVLAILRNELARHHELARDTTSRAP